MTVIVNNNLSLQTQTVVNMCRELFEQFDEIWLIGHKGDHHTILSDLKILPTGKSITLAHVHSTLGIKARYTLKPPKGSSISVESVHTNLNNSVNKHIRRIVLTNKKVCILAPFSNLKLDKIIIQNHAEDSVVVTAPTNNCLDFFKIGNKLVSSYLIEKALSNNILTKDICIPWTKIKNSNVAFDELRSILKLKKGQGMFIQIDISASGDGTELIKSQKQLDALFKDKKWSELASLGRLKASMEIKNAYSANGSACIMPISKSDCIVLVDPLSHKPTGIKKFHGKKYSGVGNDWTIKWPIEVQKQYIASATLIGKELYKEYGYTGLFGPDYVVSKSKNGQYQLRITEINPRWQGTTPYQTLNALVSKRIPLELMHYIVKLDKKNYLIPKLNKIIGNPNKYNKLSSNSSGCFYLKIGSPVFPKTIINNMNGYFLFDGKDLIAMRDKMTDLDVINCNSFGNSILVGIKAPKLNEIVGGQNLTPIGYIYGKSLKPIFSSTSPKISRFGRNLYKVVNQKVFEA